VFTITSYSAFERTTRDFFEDAVDVAHRFAAVGGLPSTITDKHGCTWRVWHGEAPAQLVECPGERTSVLRCDCNWTFSRTRAELEED
jgi:hypothetical protein